MRRRDFLAGAGATGVTALAGCAGSGDGGDGGATPTETSGGDTPTESASPAGTTAGSPSETPTLRVGTSSAFVDAPSTSPGPWLKERFESEFDATLEWKTPSNEFDYYVQRAMRGAETDADCYVGVDTGMLIRLDRELDDPLLAPAGDVAHRDEVRDGLEFDPQNRAVPYDTGYVSLVYDETQQEAPDTFDGLLEPEYEGDLIAQDPTSSATGEAFMLHTIKAKGESRYLDYWQRLKDNGVRVLGTWSDAYTAYSNGEAPMVVSYSTDQVYASQEGEDLSKHQIRFLNGQGYANPEGMARFVDAAEPDLAREFFGFVLRPEVQAEIAVRNVQFPATETAELPEEFARYAKEPSEPVTFTYDALKGNLSDWTDAWARQFASK